jgi:hypothetical protein
VADALHTQVGHARAVAARRGQLMVTVKANQPTVHALVKHLPWAQAPVGHRTRSRGHGRHETRTAKALTVATPGGLGFPRPAGSTDHPYPHPRRRQDRPRDGLPDPPGQAGFAISARKGQHVSLRLKVTAVRANQRFAT